VTTSRMSSAAKYEQACRLCARLRGFIVWAGWIPIGQFCRGQRMAAVWVGAGPVRVDPGAVSSCDSGLDDGQPNAEAFAAACAVGA
jgi:hypothetical protein